MTLRRTSDAALEPVSLEDLQDHIRVTTSDEDPLIIDLGKTARNYAEDFTNRAYIQQSWRLTMDNWPRGDSIELNRSPLFSSTGVVVSYQKSTNAGSTARTTFSSTNYAVDTESEPGRVVLKNEQSWPTDRLASANGVRVDFEAGYGSTRSAVPPQPKHFIKMTVGHWFENRESVMVGTITKEIEMSARALLWQHRVPKMP